MNRYAVWFVSGVMISSLACGIPVPDIEREIRKNLLTDPCAANPQTGTVTISIDRTQDTWKLSVDKPEACVFFKSGPSEVCWTAALTGDEEIVLSTKPASTNLFTNAAPTLNASNLTDCSGPPVFKYKSQWVYGMKIFDGSTLKGSKDPKVFIRKKGGGSDFPDD